VDALNAVVTAGGIPDIPVSIESGGANPIYPSGYDPTSPIVCSSAWNCVITGDLWNAPESVIGLSFDDGPQPVHVQSHEMCYYPNIYYLLRIIQASEQLYEFLASNSEHATHFFIGTNILQYPDLFRTAFATNQDDIAVHTWTHPYMTTKTNLEVVAEIGWTMELIHNSTGGRIPKYWRPPYGDSDMRVRAIAKEVFGLITVFWNQEYVVIWLMDSFLLTSF
jgi:chitin deacetylase